ncbi:helix-turn-helix transcriptional regulator [Dyadobacter sp. BHUBP1]|uniref:AraC family transcriptional regulator n=1 Tax=Dyadobacter sp. BHUBP1 TaxID=3424178 RepID=UPI003D32EDFB
MAAALIQSADFIHADSFPNPQLLRPQMGVRTGREAGAGHDAKEGNLKFRSWLFPDIHVMNLHWQVGRDVSIVEESRADTVNINFQMSGHMNTRFTGIAREVGMKPHQHNLIFSPEGSFRNTVRAGEQVEMFHISLRKKYFSELIGCEDRWSERAQESLLKDRPFAGAELNAGMTPYMQKLIGDIKQCGQAGAMQRLMLQSKVLELVALHLGQLQAGTSCAPGLTVGEIGRLNELKAYLDVHFLEDLSLPQLSRLCLLNEFKLKKGFRELFGTTVFAYLRKLRMDFAVNLLLDSSKSIDHISDMLGYEHPQHFSTAFKRYHGSPPSSFRS